MSLGQQEDLWYGSGASVEAEQLASQSLAARVGRVVGAKPFPASAMQLAQMTRDPRSQMDDLLQVLESDPGLSTRLLRLVNSAGFALRIPCTSVRHAAVLVGNSRLNQVATSAAILDMYDSSARHAGRILEHGTVVGSLCRYLAFYLALPSDDLFTCGFLHDIGKLMLLDTDGDAYAALLDRAADEADMLHPLEREQFGFDHALLGGHVLAQWNIPDPIPKVVAWHHNAAHAFKVSSRFGQLVCAVRLADAMSYAFKFASADSALERLAQTDAATYLGVSEAQLAAMWDEMAALAARTAAAWRSGNGVTEAISIQPTTTSLRAVRQALSAPPRTTSSEPPPALRAGSSATHATVARAHSARSLAPISSRSSASRTLESMSAPRVMTSLREARSLSLRPDVGFPAPLLSDASPLPPDARLPSSAWPLAANHNTGTVETESWPAVLPPSGEQFASEPASSGSEPSTAPQVNARDSSTSPGGAATDPAPAGGPETHEPDPAPSPEVASSTSDSAVTPRSSSTSTPRARSEGDARLPKLALLALRASLGLLLLGAAFAPAPPLTRLILVLAAASTAAVFLFTRRSLARRQSVPSPVPEVRHAEASETVPSVAFAPGPVEPQQAAPEGSDAVSTSSEAPPPSAPHLERVQADVDAGVFHLENLLRTRAASATPASPVEGRGNTADTVLRGFNRSRKKDRTALRKAFRTRR